jgi:hypothetical protein
MSMSVAYQDGLLAPETAAEKEARAEAQSDVFTKRLLVSAGIIGTLITWVLFAWFTVRSSYDIAARLRVLTSAVSILQSASSPTGCSSTTRWCVPVLDIAALLRFY